MNIQTVIASFNALLGQETVYMGLQEALDSEIGKYVRGYLSQQGCVGGVVNMPEYGRVTITLSEVANEH